MVNLSDNINSNKVVQKSNFLILRVFRNYPSINTSFNPNTSLHNHNHLLKQKNISEEYKYKSLHRRCHLSQWFH